MKITSLIFCLGLFCVKAFSQKSISLIHSSESKKSKYYNLDCANVYLVTGCDTYFIKKIGEYEFSISAEELKAIENKSQGSWVSIETYNYLYTVELDKTLFLDSDIIRIGFFKFRKGSNSHVFYSSGPSVVPSIMSREKIERKKKY